MAWARIPEQGPPHVFGVFADEASRTLWVCAATYPETQPPGARRTGILNHAGRCAMG